MQTIYIDPGLSGTGWAIFENGNYRVSGVIHCNNNQTRKIIWQERGRMIAHNIGEVIYVHKPIQEIVIEFPRVWHNTQSSVASNRGGDLLKLSCLIGNIIVYAHRRGATVCNLIHPDEWKGQLPKEVVIHRIKEKLKFIPCDHEADAIGMGLFCNKAVEA